MRTFLSKIVIVYIFCLFSNILLAQDVSYVWTDPSCPEPSDGSLVVTIDTVGYSSTFIITLVPAGYPSQEKTLSTASLTRSVTFSNLAPGSYIALVSYESNFIKTEEYVLSPSKYAAKVHVQRGSGCDDQPVGRSMVSITAGVAPYEWQWYKIGDASYTSTIHENKSNVTDMTSGLYYTVVTDFNGCVINSDTVEVVPIDISVSAVKITDILCKGKAEGEATVSVSNAVGPYIISWNDEVKNTLLSNETLSVGDQFVSVEDSIGCRDTVNITIKEPEKKIAISLDEKTNLICRGVPNGEAVLSVANYIGAISYSWSDGGTGSQRSDLQADLEYKVVVTDEYNCQDSVAFQLTQPATKVELSIVSATEPSCYGYSDGVIEVSAVGGDSGEFTYYWNGVVGAAKNETAKAGNYTVIVIDANGCTDTVSYTLSQPESLAPSFEISGSTNTTRLLCNGDSVDITTNVNGGTGTMLYDWNNSGVFVSLSTINVKAGECSVTIKDERGCLESLSTTITEPDKLKSTIEETKIIACNGDLGELTTNVTGGTGAYSYTWTNGSTLKNTGEIPVGIYSVTIADENGCELKDTYDLKQPDSLKVRAEVTSETCKSITSGTLLALVTGGTTDYTYLWQELEYGKTTYKDVSTESSLNGLQTLSKYRIQITDAHGCTSSDSIDMNKIYSYRLKMSQTKVSCPGGNDGTATVKISYGFSPYTVTWSNGVTKTIESEGDEIVVSYTEENFADGDYTISVVDNRGCDLQESFTVKTITAMSTRSLTTTETACYLPTGTATIVVTGGTKLNSAYLYEWDNGDTESTADTLSEGIHNVRVTDAKGCIMDTSVLIEKKSSLRVVAQSSDTVIHCVGGYTGKATAFAYGGDVEYTYSWSAGTFNTADATVEGLSKGLHVVTVVDNGGCSATDTIEFVEKDILTITKGVITDVSCYNGSDGKILVSTITGGVEPYSIEWINGETTYAIQSLPVGDYSTQVTDASGCTFDTTFTVYQPAEMSVSVENVTTIQCLDVCDVTADAVVTGGTGPYNYEWSSGEITGSAMSLCKGEQYITVKDGNGCTPVRKTFTVGGRDERLRITSSSITSAVCGEVNPSGKISVVTAGSVNGNYTYTWKHNGSVIKTNASNKTTEEISDLEAGSYSLNITDNVCSYDTVLSVTNSQTANAEFKYISSDCNGETYTAIISNAESAEYSAFTWFDKNGNNVSTNDTASGLRNGTYSFSALDKTGCLFMSSYTVIEKPLSITLDTIIHVNCYGKTNGSVSVDVGNTMGEVSYEWFDSNNQLVGIERELKNIGEGTYFVRAHDDNHESCPITSLFYPVTQAAQIETITATVKPSYCKDASGIAMINVIGGQVPYAYEWTDDATNVVSTTVSTNNTKDTLYNIKANLQFNVTVTDGVGCQVKDSVVITDISNFSINGIQTEEQKCKGEANAELKITTINGYSPFTYEWSHNSTLNSDIASNLSPGLYSVTVTDNLGCKVSFDFDSVKVVKPILLEFFETPEIACKNSIGDIFVTIKSGGYEPFTYKWFNESNTLIASNQELTGRFAGIYKAIAIDKYSCPSDTVTYVLNEPDDIKAEFSVKLTECGDSSAVGEITLDTISGGLADGIYRFRWGTISETGTWTTFDSETNRTLSKLQAGEYICTITNATNPESCYITESLYTNPERPDSIVIDLQHTHCSYYTEEEIKNDKVDGSLEITKIFSSFGDYQNSTEKSITDYSIVWNDSKNQSGAKAEHLFPGEYRVTVTGENDCYETFSAGKINAFVDLQTSIYSLSDNDTVFNRKAICLADSAELAASISTTYNEGYVPLNTTVSYEWSDVKDNCEATISSHDEKSTWVTPLTKYYSDSTLIILQSKIDGCTSKAANYILCHYDSLNFAIEVLDTAGISIGEDSVSVLEGDKYLLNPVDEPWYVDELDGAEGAVSIFWRSFKPDMVERGAIPDTTTNRESYNRSGYYGLMTQMLESNYIYAVATTTHGCIERASVFVDVYSTMRVPTGFTPNGDGINDTWVIPFLSSYPDAKIKVFNRWGELVYENKKVYSLNPWNGNAKNGNKLPMGTYYYVIDCNDEENNLSIKTGSISIIR